MKISSVAALLLLVLTGGFARAATIKLDPPTTTIASNGTFTLQLLLDATGASGDDPGAFSGEVIVDFDKTLLRYDGLALAGGVSYFQSPVVTTTGNAQNVRFGFDNAARVGTVGTFSFTAIGNPGNLATVGLVDGDVAGGGSFVNMNGTNLSFIPTPTGAQVSIVPLPAGVWLLGTGLGALVARRRFRHAAH